MDVRPAYRSALLVALALVLASSGLYLYLGTPGAIYPENRQAPEEGSDQIGQMVDQLAARLAKNPNDPKGWAMLARSYKVMHRFNDAENAFSHIPDLLHSDPDLMANHADMLAAENNGNLEGEPLQEVEEALAINPDHPMALMLAGTAAYNRHDVAAARKYWSHLLSVMPADSEDAQPLRDALAKLDGAAAPAVATVGPALTGTVAVTAGLTGKIQAGDTLFVYAQAEQGPPMPLAVSRVPASSLPYSFRLDDSMAMSPQMVLSHFKQVRIKARISHSGQAMPAPGDLLGASPAIASDASNIHIVIDQVMP